MGAKRPEPPPYDPNRYDADRPTSPPPPPEKKYHGVKVTRSLDTHLAMERERDDLRRQLEASRKRERKLRAAVELAMVWFIRDGQGSRGNSMEAVLLECPEGESDVR